LNVYAQSKGRTPGVFLFNPFTEGRLSEGKQFNPTKLQAQLARDLEHLPQFLCRQDDVVLISRKPSVAFLSRLKDAGFPLPEYVECEGAPGFQSVTESGRVVLRQLAARKLGTLRPWAWGPDSCELLQPLFASVTGEQRSPAARFNEGLARLYSKSWSANFLRQLLAAGATGAEVFPQDCLCTEQEVGVPVRSPAEALTAIAAIRARGHHPVVVKQSFGVAGSNSLRLLEPDPLPAQFRWLDSAFARGQEVVVEPWLDRLADFSAQLEMTPQGLKLCGYTGLVNDPRGQFVANYAEAHHHKRVPAAVVSLFPGHPDISGHLLALYAEIFARLETELRAVDFRGPLGVDALVYRDRTGRARLKPVVEINPRYTMGRVLVELMRQTSQNSAGVFRLVNAVQVRAEGFESFADYAQSLEEKYPLQWDVEPVRRIREGACCLNEPLEVSSCLAVLRVGRRLDDLLPPRERS
jgi:hypothetical protein